MFIATHDGKFHADELIALSTIRLAFGQDFKLPIRRTRDAEVLEEISGNGGILVDVGGVCDPLLRKFDHHQRDFNEVDGSGVKYAAAGCVWREYATRAVENVSKDLGVSGLMSDEDIQAVSEAVRDSIIRPVDRIDNGQIEAGVSTVASISWALSSMNLTTLEEGGEEAEKAAFRKALVMAKEILIGVIKHAIAGQLDAKLARETISNATDGVAIFQSMNAAWKQVAMDFPSLKLVIYPNPGGRPWRVQTPPLSLEEFTSMRCPAPAKARALSGEALKSLTGVDDAEFVHAAGFIGGASTREGAEALARWWIANA